MEAGKLIQQETTASPAAAHVKMNDCWTKKNENATFLEDLKDHFDDYIHKSVEGHMNCLKSKMEKVNSFIDQVFSVYKKGPVVAAEANNDAKAVESNAVTSTSSVAADELMLASQCKSNPVTAQATASD